MSKLENSYLRAELCSTYHMSHCKESFRFTVPASRKSAILSWQFLAIHQYGNAHPHLAWKMWCKTTADDGL